MKHLKHWVWVFGLVFFLSGFYSEAAHARNRVISSTHNGTWLASGGFGLTFSPTLVLFNPQFEFQHSENLFFGPMMQLGVGDYTLFTFSGTARYLFPTQSRLRPSMEGGLGIALGSSYFSTAVGIEISAGMGIDYEVDSNWSLGTMFRVNFAPPLKTFFLSWPLVVARIRI